MDDDQAKQPVGIITETDIVQAVADGKDVNDVRIRALWMTMDTTPLSPHPSDPAIMYPPATAPTGNA